jgi:hypothetical protein
VILLGLTPWLWTGVASAQVQVTLCHRSMSQSNPYNTITVSDSFALNHAANHPGPVWARAERVGRQNPAVRR